MGFGCGGSQPPMDREYAACAYPGGVALSSETPRHRESQLGVGLTVTVAMSLSVAEFWFTRPQTVKARRTRPPKSGDAQDIDSSQKDMTKVGSELHRTGTPSETPSSFAVSKECVTSHS